MSYEYSGTLFDNINQAACAAVWDFVYAQGQNSWRDVAETDADEALKELLEVGWDIPGVTDPEVILGMLKEIIAAAKAKAAEDGEA